MLFIGSVWHLFYFREGVGIIESSYNLKKINPGKPLNARHNILCAILDSFFHFYTNSFSSKTDFGTNSEI